MATTNEPKLNTKDKAIIAFQGALMAVPFVGSTLTHFIFGPLAELRVQRIEKTLSEVAERIGEKKAAAAVNEHFTTLLESVTPELSRALSEDKRQRFRDLLTNTAELPEGSEGWEEAQLASLCSRRSKPQDSQFSLPSRGPEPPNLWH